MINNTEGIKVGRKEGRMDGRKEGRKEGIKVGRKEGWMEGRKEEKTGSQHGPSRDERQGKVLQIQILQ